MSVKSQTKELIIWMTGVVITTMICLLLALPFESKKFRNPASLIPESIIDDMSLGQSSKELILKGHSDEHPHGIFDRPLQKYGKGSSLIAVEITAPRKKPGLGQNDYLELKATIEAFTEVDDLEYVWLLPEGISAPTGALEGSLGSLTLGETRSIQLGVVTETSENRQVHLHVFRKVNGEAVGHMAQYNTMLQEAIDEKIRAKADTLKRHPSVQDGDFKLMQ